MFDPKSGAKIYKGQFKAGLKHGTGIEYDQSGNKKYKGDFEKDSKIGIGHDYDEDGNLIYKGKFFLLNLTNLSAGVGRGSNSWVSPYSPQIYYIPPTTSDPIKIPPNPTPNFSPSKF